MAVRFQRHLLFILTFCLSAISCLAAEDGLTNRRVVIDGSHKYVYEIQVPKDDTGVLKIYGGHGNSFGLGYRDSSFIYYINDADVSTTNSSGNDEPGEYSIPGGGLETAKVISEQQVNGRYWKEVFHNGYYIGYRNVPKEKLDAFNKSLRTFNQSK